MTVTSGSGDSNPVYATLEGWSPTCWTTAAREEGAGTVEIPAPSGASGTRLLGEVGCTGRRIVSRWTGPAHDPPGKKRILRQREGEKPQHLLTFFPSWHPQVSSPPLDFFRVPLIRLS